MNAETLTARNKNIVVQNLEGEVLIYDLITNKAYCLNETSSMIWGMCDGKTSVTEMSRKLSLKLKQTVGEDLVWLAIDQLKKQDLLENSREIHTKLDGLSRREIIRRVGLASAVALPAISSLVAPTAAMAQSTCSNPGGSATGTLVGVCAAGVGQPPATLATCTATCQSTFGSVCASCTTTTTPSPAIPNAFECRCT
jgi:hypothetical protein